MIYEVDIIETLKKTVEVEASSEQEALHQVGERYADDDWVLDSGDLFDAKFELRNNWST